MIFKVLCHSYVIRMFSYVIQMYSYVSRMTLTITCMSAVCQSYILVCHPYVGKHVPNWTQQSFEDIRTIMSRFEM